MSIDEPFVLVVEDDDEFRTVLIDTLSAKGYRVAAARNGKDALEQLDAGAPPDMILMDLWMPEMDGWQLRHALSSQGSQIPIVVMTAAPTQQREGLAVVEVLVKPFTLDQLLTVVRRHLLDAELPAPAPRPEAAEAP